VDAARVKISLACVFAKNAKTMTKKSLMKMKEIGLAQNSKWYYLENSRF